MVASEAPKCVCAGAEAAAAPIFPCCRGDRRLGVSPEQSASGAAPVAVVALAVGGRWTSSLVRRPLLIAIGCCRL